MHSALETKGIKIKVLHYLAKQSCVYLAVTNSEEK